MTKDLDTAKECVSETGRRKPPCAALDMRENGVLHIELDGEWDRIQKAARNTPFVMAWPGRRVTWVLPGSASIRERRTSL